uniref:Uncharacterized protein n=1 Tax=Anguilla anguilla TaxID=7936 RepID=A0A0E9XQH8_ANGAN
MRGYIVNNVIHVDKTASSGKSTSSNSELFLTIGTNTAV